MMAKIRAIHNLGFILLLLAHNAAAQTCIDDIGSYAADFPAGSSERWLYDFIAPGAECISISRTQTEDDRCNEHIFNIPDDEWVQYPGHKLPGQDDLILNVTNYSEYVKTEPDGSKTFPKEVCINACRVRPWCKSADWSYGYDKCRLSRSHGDPVPAEDYVTYVEKPVCIPDTTPRNNSLSYTRLGLKLFASMRYEMALAKMTTALEADGWSAMNYVSVALFTLVAGEFSASSIDDARVVMSRTANRDFPFVTVEERVIIAAFNTSLYSNTAVALTLAASTEEVFENSRKSDAFMGVVSCISYKNAGIMARFKSLLLDVLVANPDDIAALTLYLNSFASSRSQLAVESETEVLRYIGALRTADPNNPLTLKLASFIYSYYEMFLETSSAATGALDVLPGAVFNGFMSASAALQIRLYLYSLSFQSYLYRFDEVEAAGIEAQILDEANNATYDQDTKVEFTALLYRMKAKFYFQLAFSQKPDYLRTQASRDVNDVVQIDASDSLFTIARISEYMYRQSIVTQQIRNGSDASYDAMIRQWERLRDNALRFDTNYADIVNYNLNILRIELESYNMLSGAQRSIFGDNGFLHIASVLAQQINEADRMYLVMEIEEITAYAVNKLAKAMPSPLGRSDNSQLIARDLMQLLDRIRDTFPLRTPNKYYTIASIQLALGDTVGSLETLDEARSRMIGAQIVWLNDLKRTVESADVVVSILELQGDIGFIVPAANKLYIFDGLDKEWSWTVPLSSLEPCTAFRYRNIGNDDITWTRESERSLISSDYVSYFSTNADTCALRCLFEKKFACKAFTFGFNRCLLHDQKYSDSAVPTAKKFTNLDDEVYFEVPTCVEGSTNAYSETINGLRAFSNGLPLLALEKFNIAIQLDPLMSLPKLIKALILHNRCDEVLAEDILMEPMLMTRYEDLLAKLINKTINGGVRSDILNKFVDIEAEFPNDNLVILLRSIILREPLTGVPVISGHYLVKIVSDPWNSNDEINQLEVISPESPRPWLFRVYRRYLRGDWRTLLIYVNDLLTSNSHIGFTSDSSARKLALQLQHFALVQLGRYSSAREMYNRYKDDERLGALMYATQIYTQLINSGETPSASVPGVLANSSECVNVNAMTAKTVALVMNAVKVFKNPSIDNSQKELKRTQLDNVLSGITLVSMKDIWKNVADTFYRLETPAGVGFANDMLNADAQAQVFLSPTIDLRNQGLELVSPQELYVWAKLSQPDPSPAYRHSDFQEMSDRLGEVMSQRPSRTVSLWLKYKLYRQWRVLNPAMRNQSIAAAQDVVDQWRDGEENTNVLFAEINSYKTFPDTTERVTVKQIAVSQLTGIPDWSLYLIIALSAAVVIAILISCVWCYVSSRKQNHSDKLYSGSIYSASTSGDNVVPEPGEVMYADRGQRNEGMTDPEMDFKN